MLISGCSHAAGSEIDGQEDSFYNRSHSFGNLLANKLGFRPVNIAQNGMTNSGIARSILQWFKQFYKPDMKVFVLISWTESTRLEVSWPTSPITNNRWPPYRKFYYNECSKAADWFDPTANSFFRINLGWAGGDDMEKELFPYYHEFIAKNEYLIELQTINYILQIQYFLKSKHIPYVMCNAMHMCTTPNEVNDMYLDLVDSSRYINMKNNDMAFFWKYKNLGYTNPKAKYWHHGEEPHSLFADELHQFIGDKACLLSNG